MFLVLYEEVQSKNPEYEWYPVFHLDNISEADCYAEFRFEKKIFHFLLGHYNFIKIRCERRSMCDGVEGLCMLLRRIAYPCRYSDLISRFGRPVSALILKTNQVLDEIFYNHSHRIVQWNNNILNPPALQNYSNKFCRKTVLDLLMRHCSSHFSTWRTPNAGDGHKRVHALKFQSLALPNGLIGHLFGPVR